MVIIELISSIKQCEIYFIYWQENSFEIIKSGKFHSVRNFLSNSTPLWSKTQCDCFSFSHRGWSIILSTVVAPRDKEVLEPVQGFCSFFSGSWVRICSRTCSRTIRGNWIFSSHLAIAWLLRTYSPLASSLPTWASSEPEFFPGQSWLVINMTKKSAFSTCYLHLGAGFFVSCTSNPFFHIKAHSQISLEKEQSTFSTKCKSIIAIILFLWYIHISILILSHISHIISLSLYIYYTYKHKRYEVFKNRHISKTISRIRLINQDLNNEDGEIWGRENLIKNVG